MSVKQQILGILEGNQNGYVSGADIAETLSVSRNSVWKAVEALRAGGYTISAVKRKGYSLSGVGGDILSAAGIVAQLRHKDVFCIETRKSVTSTNTVLREMAAKGAPEGCVIAAEGQTAGKGRLGRTFYSPAGHGAYFSLLLRPDYSADDAALITSAAAVAAAHAIRDIFGVRVGIKWVNDILAFGKKVCGILTEASFSMESGLIDSAILGVGVNITTPDHGVPGELRGIADAITNRRDGQQNERCRLIAATLDNFWDYYMNLPARAYLKDYRALSVILEKDVFVHSSGNIKPARALSIDDDCGLVVRYENGGVETLRSGEVSIRVSGENRE